ncbi:MAG: hypothetical protein OEU26_08465 [Candidatus Tectomicrobia bacterium]|nr:hypothetical protein [Candidatus Tectomicrobia bacterium]
MRYGSGQSGCHKPFIWINESSLLALEAWQQHRTLIPVARCAWITATYLRRFCWVFFLLIPILASTEHLAFSRPSVPVIEGIAVIHRQNEADARKRALRTGWRTAVELAVADLADIDVRVANAHLLQMQVYEKASQYIQSYHVLWDYPDATHQLYRVGLNAEVAMERLAQKLVALGISPP